MTRKPPRQPGSKAKAGAPVKPPTKPARKAARAPRAPDPPKPEEPAKAPEVPPAAAGLITGGKWPVPFVTGGAIVIEPPEELVDGVDEARPEIDVHLRPPTVLYVVDPGDGYADLAPAMVANPRVSFQISGSAPASEAIAIGQTFADKLQLQIDIVGQDGVLQTLIPQPPLPPETPRRVRVKSADRDWTERPEIAPGVNLGINGLLDRIEAARGNLPKLLSMVGTFRGSRGTDDDYRKASTYYRIAGRYLSGLIGEARGNIGHQLNDGQDLHPN